MTEESKSIDATSLSLLQRVGVNDQRAWDRLVAIYGRLVFYWCQRAGVHEADIPDLVQEVFQAVFRGIGSFEREPGQGSFRGWLRTITLNKLRDYGRRSVDKPVASGGTSALEMLQQSPEVDLLESDNEDPNDRQLILEQVLTLVESDFAPTTWQAFRMTMFQDMTSPEVAAKLEISANAVRHAKARVLRRLRQELDGLVDL